MDRTQAQRIIYEFEREARNPNWSPNILRASSYAEAQGYLERDAQLRPLIEELVKKSDLILAWFRLHEQNGGLREIPEHLRPWSLFGELGQSIDKAKSMGFGK